MLEKQDLSIVESFRPDRGANCLAVIGAVSIIALGIVYSAGSSHWAVGMIGIVAGSLFLISPVQYLLWRKPTLILDKTGFSLTLPSLSRQPYFTDKIAWRDVDNVVVVVGGPHSPIRTVQVALKRNSGLASQLSNGTAPTLVKIPELAVNIRPSELALKMRRYFESP